MSEVNRRHFMQMSAALGAVATMGDLQRALAMGLQETPDSLVGITLTEASRRIHAHQLTSTELVKAYLDRIKIYQPKLNCFITVMSDKALAQAAALDADAKAGKFHGPLHGIPIVLKDNIDTAGTRTTAASQVFDDRVPTEDAFVTAKLLNAGAVILGKSNLHEFAMGHTSATTYFGPVRNAWDPAHTPAGSSGGSGVAVSADLCVAALGTDTGGSVRMPAAYCSVVGLKPTYGLVSIRGIIPLTYSLDHCGPMTKTVEDAALLLNSMAGFDKLDVGSREHPAEDYVQSMKQPVSKLRLGIPRAPFYDQLDEATASCVEAAIEVLSKIVASVKDVSMPSTQGFNTISLSGESDVLHLELDRKSHGNGYSMDIKRGVETGIKELNDVSQVSCSEKVVDYIESNWALVKTRRTIDDAFTDFDLIALPTMRVVAPTINSAVDRAENPKPLEPFVDSNCRPFDVWGIPAVSIPCGFSEEGLPVGLMIAGPNFSEGRVLALAHAYEQATQWHLKKPPLTPDMKIPALVRKSGSPNAEPVKDKEPTKDKE
jgi:aspartyl-tRNA(Asn)/glutamyl-tRNA(Gln) amidotransferase subunit A